MASRKLSITGPVNSGCAYPDVDDASVQEPTASKVNSMGP